MSKRKQNLSNSPRKRRNLGKKDKVDDQLKLDIPVKTKPNENEFGNDWINMSLNLISSKGVDKSFKEIFISCQLLYENGDVTNNIQYHTNPNPIKLTKGQCNFKIKIDTLSMYNDNRSYKIVFSVSNNIGRHVEDYTTKAFKLVKHRLEISEQPDEKFYKDEGGRSHCLSTKIVLKDSQGNVVTNRTIPLQCKLVYEDLTPAQSQREILAILSQNLDIKNGYCVINFRINEVSKNHNKRAFRILMECAKKQNTSFHDISSCITNPIMVYSKRTKPTSKKKKHNRRHSKRKKKRYSDDDFDDDYDDISNDDFDLDNNDNNGNHIRIKRNVFRSGLPSNPPESELLNNNPPIKMENNTEINTDGGLLGTMFEWCKLADWIMKKLEWTKCGYEFDEGTNAIDMNRPLYRCPYCLRYRNKAGNGKHENNCQLRIAMNEYNSKVKVMGMEWKYHTNNEPNMNGMGSLESAKSSPLNKENHNNHDNNSMHMNGNNNRHAHTHHNIIIRPPPMQMWPYPPFEHHIPPKHINAPTLPALNNHPNNNNNHHNNGNHINNNMNNNINNNNNNSMHNPVNNNINHNMHSNMNNNISNNVNNSMNLNNNNNNNSEIKQETSRLPTQLSRVRSIKRGISSSKYGNPCYDENGDFFGSFNPHNNTFFNKDQLNTFDDWKLDEMGIPNSMPQQSSEFITRHDTWDDNTFYQYIHDDYMTHIN